jgi:glucose-1-phosphate cytidylyltransferase
MKMKIAILCGGRGKRLRPYTEEIPKTLVPLNDKPILDYNLELFSGQKLNNFVLCVGYKGEKIREHIRRSNLQDAPYKVTFSEAGEDASMLKRIHQLKEETEETILVTYGDTLTDINVENLRSYHLEKGGIVTIVVASIQNPFGLVDFGDNGLAYSFQEKPYFNYYIGMFILNNRAFEYMDDELLRKPDGEGLVSFFNRMIDEKQLMVYQYDGKQITFNTHRERELAEEMVKTFYTV